MQRLNPRQSHFFTLYPTLYGIIMENAKLLVRNKMKKMRVVKMLIKHTTEPVFLSLDRIDYADQQILVSYPISSPYRNRSARWYSFREVSIQWVKTLDFIEE